MNLSKMNIDWSELKLPKVDGEPVNLLREGEFRIGNDLFSCARYEYSTGEWFLVHTRERRIREVLACIDAINTYAHEHSYEVFSGREVLARLLVNKETIRIRDTGSKGAFVACQLNSDIAAAALDGFVVRLGDKGAQTLGKFALGTYEVQLGESEIK